MLEFVCAIMWVITATIGFRIGGCVATKRGSPATWALPPASFSELFRRGALDAFGERLLPWYTAGVVLSSALFVIVAARRLL